jgi:hypothetical protein
MIHKIIDGNPIPANIRAEFPNTSFPADLSRAVLPEGYVWVAPSSPPECGPFERAEVAAPALVDGAWVQQWSVAPLTAGEVQSWRNGLICGPLQMRKALRQTGDYAAVTAAMEQADEETQEAWEYASEVRRTDPMIEAMRLVLGKTAEEVDALFLLAQSL